MKSTTVTSLRVLRSVALKKKGPRVQEHDNVDLDAVVDRSSQKGLALEAHRADKMVMQGIRVAQEVHMPGVPFYMENPVVPLARRPCRRRWAKGWRGAGGGWCARRCTTVHSTGRRSLMNTPKSRYDESPQPDRLMWPMTQ